MSTYWGNILKNWPKLNQTKCTIFIEDSILQPSNHFSMQLSLSFAMNLCICLCIVGQTSISKENAESFILQ